MQKVLKIIFISCLLSVFILYNNAPVNASWETGVKTGFVTNIDRAVDSGTDDSYLSTYLSFFREPSGESRLNLALTTTLEGVIYRKLSDLSYVDISFAPAVLYFPHRKWSIILSPFLHAKGVSDSDQSALSFGGRLSLEEQILKNFYLGQYYIYEDSAANEEIYSFKDHAVGIYTGLNLTRSFFIEIGYEYSYGDSFRSISTTETTISGKGKHSTYSTSYESFLVQDTVTCNTIGINAGVDWTKSLSLFAGYAYTRGEGDMGSFTSYSGFIGISYRF
ncbi:MAG: hypothetical protein AB1610_01510 [Nitrospirota bacterium]